MVFKRVQFAASATAASATFELEIAQLAATMEELKAGRKPSAVAVVRGDMQKLRILYGRAVGTIARGFAAFCVADQNAHWRHCNRLLRSDRRSAKLGGSSSVPS